MKLTAERLRELIHYDKTTGIFMRRPGTTRRRWIGKPAGCLTKYGYISILVAGRVYQAHCLAWLYVKGFIPKEIDHKNTIRSDNRWCNLREATRSLNRANSKVGGNNHLGIKGVRLYRSGKFQARFLQRHLGYFNTLEEARLAYITAAKKHFGEFARAQ